MKKLLLVIFFIAFFFFVFQLFSARMTPVSYYAVFLTNGQIYFGHMTKLTSELIKLEDVYYLRTQTNLSSETFSDKKEENDIHLSLVRLGKEIHAPKGEMMINRQQVLFWEELREDGEVVKAIQKYK